MDKWEYKVIYINANKTNQSGLPEEVNVKFNEYGEQGSELVKVEPRQGGGFMALGFGWLYKTIGYVAFFKRKKV